MENVSGLLYKEDQTPPAWLYILLFLWLPIIVAAIFIANPRAFERIDVVLAILIGAFFELFLIGLIGKMTILVRWNELIVKIGFLGLRTLRIRKGEIKSVEVVEGKLWKMYGGWGIKGAFGMIAYVYSDGGGVEIELINSKQGLLKTKLRKVVISSKNPWRLADAIMSMS